MMGTFNGLISHTAWVDRVRARRDPRGWYGLCVGQAFFSLSNYWVGHVFGLLVSYLCKGSGIVDCANETLAIFWFYIQLVACLQSTCYDTPKLFFAYFCAWTSKVWPGLLLYDIAKWYFQDMVGVQIFAVCFGLYAVESCLEGVMRAGSLQICLSCCRIFVAQGGELP